MTVPREPLSVAPAGPRLGPLLCPHLATWSGASQVRVGVSYWPRPLGGSTCPRLGGCPRPASSLPAASVPECLSLLPRATEGLRATGLGRPGTVSPLILFKVAVRGIKMTLVCPKPLHVGNKNMLGICSLLCRESKKSGTHVTWRARQRWENPAHFGGGQGRSHAGVGVLGVYRP